MSEADIRAERIKKIDLLKAGGMEAYPVSTARDTTNADFLVHFEELSKDEKGAILGGRVMSLRGQGGIIFATIFDGTERVQLVFQKDEMDQTIFDLWNDTVDVGDFVEAAGAAYVTKRGAQSLKVRTWKMLTKSLIPIPDEWFGLKDEEKKLRERYVDLLIDPETRSMIERRSKFWRTIRDFLHEREFMEVETPVFESTPGGADARPFITHHNALDIDVYLRISLELWQKRLLVAGFPKVFEIGRIFRNEGQSREHAQDYTQLETYEAFSDMQKGMEFIKDMYRQIAKEVYGKYTFTCGEHTFDLAEEWGVIDYCDIIQKEYGIDPITCTEEEAIQAARDAHIVFGEAPNKPRAIDHLWKKLRKKIAGPAFLINQPKFMEPLAKSMPGNPNIVERMQVILAGSEMGKGFSELNDPIDQYERFAEQQAMRDAGDDEAQRLDTDFVRALEYGMPPAFGFGVSERLFSFLENRPILEAQTFPLLRPENSAGGKTKE